MINNGLQRLLSSIGVHSAHQEAGTWMESSDLFGDRKALTLSVSNAIAKFTLKQTSGNDELTVWEIDIQLGERRSRLLQSTPSLQLANLKDGINLLEATLSNMPIAGQGLKQKLLSNRLKKARAQASVKAEGSRPKND